MKPTAPQDITVTQLRDCLGCSIDVAKAWHPHVMLHMIPGARVLTALQAAMLLAQVGHESAGLTKLVESLDYSAQALRRVWPGRFSEELAQQVGRTPHHAADQVRIAQIAYGGRMGNAAYPSLDGWKYRGHGPIHITGRTNMAALQHDSGGLKVLEDPRILTTPQGGSIGTAWYWRNTGNDLNAMADRRNVTAVSAVINTGRPTSAPAAINGLADRVQRFERCCKILGVS